MPNVTLATAKSQLSALVERAAQGEAICITRRGKPIAQITKVDRPRKPISLTALRAVTDAIPKLAAPPERWMEKMRDEDRY